MQLTRRSWFVLVMALACLVAVPVCWYLADAGAFRWTLAELRWNQLRRQPATSAAADDQSFVTLRRTGCFGSVRSETFSWRQTIPVEDWIGRLSTYSRPLVLGPARLAEQPGHQHSQQVEPEHRHGEHALGHHVGRGRDHRREHERAQHRVLELAHQEAGRDQPDARMTVEPGQRAA